MNNDIFAAFPVIMLGDIILRQCQPEKDYQDFFHYMTKPEVAKYLSDDDTPKDLMSAMQEVSYWANLFNYKNSFYWAIALADSNKLIGTCGFHNWSKCHRRAEISYDLDSMYWNKGITTKAINAIIDFGYRVMKLQRLQAVAAIDNISSIRVLEKTGFKVEGILEQYGVLKGEVKDFYMYSRIFNKR